MDRAGTCEHGGFHVRKYQLSRSTGGGALVQKSREEEQ